MYKPVIAAPGFQHGGERETNGELPLMCRSKAMSPEDSTYYRERAAAERQCAAESTNPHAREIHQKLAELYERLIALDEAQGDNRNIAGGTAAVA